MTNRPSEPEMVESEQDARAVVRFVKRMFHHWPAVLICLGLSALACAAFVYFRHPPFRSETVLLYSPGVSSADTSEESRSAKSATARLKELLLSRPKLSQVVSAFGLYPEVQKKYGKEDAVEELKRHIEFKAPGGDTFNIAFTGGSPGEAQRVTQALAQIVIDGDAELRKSQAELARDFLATERANKATDLRNAEQRLAVFMGEHRRFALDATPLVAGAAIRATAAATPAPAAGPVRYYAPQARAATPAQPGTHAPAAAAAPSPDAEERSRALAALAAARANLAEQLRHYTAQHPDVRAAQGEVDRATARVAALGPAPQAQPVAAPAPAATAQEAAPARRVVSAPRPVAAAAPAANNEKEDVVALETEWAKLTREVTAARQRLDQVEAALFKADVLASSERAGRAVQISVIDPAFLPERPLGLGLNIIIGLFLAVGLALGVMGAALAAAVDDHVYGSQDIVRVTEVLVQVPKLSLRRRAYAAE